MNHPIRGLFLLFLLSFLASPAFALPPDPIGRIQTLRGEAHLLRGDLSVPAAVGHPVYNGDRVRTAKDGAVGVVLTDDTTFSLGPNSEIAIKDYAFEPKEERFSLFLRVIKGTCVYFSGLIGKLRPNAVRLEIPDATIAVRGTKLLMDVRG